MNDLQSFNNAEFGQVRTLVLSGTPWFVGKDIATALGYENATKAIRDHVDNDDKKMGVQNVTPSITDSLGRKQYPTLINESGLYSLVLSSKLPTAKKFKHWVTSDVLPTTTTAAGACWRTCPSIFTISPKGKKIRARTCCSSRPATTRVSLTGSATPAGSWKPWYPRRTKTNEMLFMPQGHRRRLVSPRLP